MKLIRLTVEATTTTPSVKRTLSQQLALARGEDLSKDEGQIEDFLKGLQAQDSSEKFSFIQPQLLEYCDELGRGAFGAVWKVSRGFVILPDMASVSSILSTVLAKLLSLSKFYSTWKAMNSKISNKSSQS